MKAIRYYSEINPWVAGIVICQDADYRLANIAIGAGLREWSKAGSLLCEFTHSFAVAWALRFLDVTDYQIICHDSENTTKEYEDFWKDIVDQFPDMTSINVGDVVIDGFWSEALKAMKTGP